MRQVTNYSGQEIVLIPERGSRSWDDHYAPIGGGSYLDSLFDEPVLEDDE